MSEDEDAGDLFFVDKVGEKPNVVGVKGAITKEEEQLALQLFGSMPLQKRDERGEEDFGVAEERSAGKRARVSAPAWHEDDNEEEDEQRLRQQFEERNGALPGWAQQDVAPPSVFSTTANVLRSVGANVLLDPKFLKVQKLANLNVEGRSTTDVDSLCFSDSAQIALTAGRDKTLRLFQVNEKKCVKLHSVFFDDLPIQRAVFLPRRHEVLCLGYKKPFYLYDLESGAATRVPHLMGQLENKWSDVVPSPDGQYSAFLGGESGNVVLFSNRSRQAAFTLKAGGPVSCAAFSADGGPYLWTSGAESEIWQWDMRTRRCVGRRRDLGGLGARALSNSPDGRWQAVGDKSGVVNVYALGGESPESPEAPEAPEKSVGNLVTACSLLRWSADSQLLAAGSSSAPGALRLVHAPSFRVFANWPAQLPALVSALDFSPNSGFLALGTRGGDALLFRLLSYPNY